MALDHLFQGSALNAVDGKGRVSIPSFLRSVIERRGDAKTIVLAKHVNFPALYPIVEDVCREYGVRYNEHRSFRAGLASHFRWLRQMGKPSEAS